MHLFYHLGTMCSNLKHVFVSKGLLNFHGEKSFILFKYLFSDSLLNIS